MRSFLIRLAVAIVAIPAFLWVFHQGGHWLRGLVALLALLGFSEAQRLAKKAGAPFPLWPGLLLVLLVPWLAGDFWANWSWPAWLAATVLVAAIPAFRAADIRQLAAGIAAQIGTIVWIAVGLGALMALRTNADGQGFWWLILLFANLWIGDTAAYLFGVWLGKAKLAPLVSPKKTIAGSVAQVIASLAVGLGVIAGGWIDAPAGLLVAASLVIGIVGQIGDLFESVLKRAAGEKDSSHLIPGHGGVLDRFDSAMLAAPCLHLLLSLWPR
jgi:phosphatidate cytidylyltransferase